MGERLKRLSFAGSLFHFRYSGQTHSVAVRILGMRLSVWQCGQGTVIDCEEAMIDLTSLRRPAKPAYVAGLTEITRKVCVPKARSPMETYSPGRNACAPKR